MRLILAQYLRTLRERDEFDRLLPDLLLSMGYVPVSKPQTGNRQYGVDMAAVGKHPEDGIRELLCLVIKRGDLGRNEWDSGPQSSRQSLNEVFDVYLKTHVEPQHEPLRKRIVLATTGDLKQDTQINWDSYAKGHSGEVTLDFWGGDKIATLIERFMLSEHVFDATDRSDLRKSLALAGELEYDQKDLHRLFKRVLGVSDQGQLTTKNVSKKDLVKALRVVSLAAQIFSHWAEDEGNLKQALFAVERAMLWSWHRINLEEEKKRKQFYQEFGESFWRCYREIALRYFEKLQPHYYVKDGLSGYCRESAVFSLVIFEQIGVLGSIGLSCILVVPSDEETKRINFENAAVVADALVALLENNPITGSPMLDGNVVDIVLGFILLVFTGRVKAVSDWLAELIKRVDFTMKLKRNFPVCTDSVDDLVELSIQKDEEIRVDLMKISWLLPTLAGWSVVLKRDDLYEMIARNSKTEYPEVCLQLWHPTAQELPSHLYFERAHYRCGESEAPIILPDTAQEYRVQMEALLKSERHNVIATSTAGLAGMPAFDLIANRHFRTPVAPFYWFQFLLLRD
ncbi:hypothetical protein FY034_04750 [Trichlorobacter lovleyi]|uniref:hypothetical protein n=1 Tax=Trichlorobacter lovleyi TaxID=313985 RepID=UPI0022407AA6|nr:hypothetical protein [Trichlorobacter lovleyi]QOX78269.1 hypothetical protein FY034_04750 [Trichlorobacter lovleyi]